MILYTISETFIYSLFFMIWELIVLSFCDIYIRFDNNASGNSAYGSQSNPRYRVYRSYGTSFITQDPYCKVYLGGQMQRSSTCQSGGKTPHWNDVFYFTVMGDPMLRAEVWDNDAV